MMMGGDGNLKITRRLGKQFLFSFSHYLNYFGPEKIQNKSSPLLLSFAPQEVRGTEKLLRKDLRPT
jgi:hypothetical protein